MPSLAGAAGEVVDAGTLTFHTRQRRKRRWSRGRRSRWRRNTRMAGPPSSMAKAVRAVVTGAVVGPRGLFHASASGSGSVRRKTKQKRKRRRKLSCRSSRLLLVSFHCRDTWWVSWVQWRICCRSCWPDDAWSGDSQVLSSWLLLVFLHYRSLERVCPLGAVSVGLVVVGWLGRVSTTLLCMHHVVTCRLKDTRASFLLWSAFVRVMRCCVCGCSRWLRWCRTAGTGVLGPSVLPARTLAAPLRLVKNTISQYPLGASWCCPALAGTKYLTLSGENSAGVFNEAALTAIASSVADITSAGNEGVMFDVEEMQGSSGTMVPAFAHAFAAVKGAGLRVAVTTSHSELCQCDTPEDAVAF